jgi:putative ABC transport system permease protein
VNTLAAPRRPPLSLAIKIALRELRAGAGGLVVFVFCIALGVAAIAAIGSLSAAFDQALTDNGRTLIGGDISFELVHARATADERRSLARLGAVSESASLRAMARYGGKSALVELKAVDNAYPLFGTVGVLAPKGAGAAWRRTGVVLVEPTLLARLGLAIGDRLKIGDAQVTIGGTLGQQPDRLADRLAYGPHVLLSLATLAKTHLVQPGSLVRWTYRLKLPHDTGTDPAVLARARIAIRNKFPQAGFEVRDWTDPAPDLRRDTRRFTQFVGLIGLTALLLGGIGVGNAIHAYMTKKRDVIAIFKSLGATSRLVLAVYLSQALLLTAAGIAVGLAIGAATPAILSALYGSALPIALATAPHPLPLAVAAAAGLLTMALFVLWPLGRASAIPPAALMRDDLGGNARLATAWPFAAASLLAACGLFALAIATSTEKLITGAICLGIFGSFILFLGVGWVLQRLAGRFRGAVGTALALALARIAGPGSLARAVSLSLGLGLGFLVAVALIDHSLLIELRGDIGTKAPAYYFLDLDPADLAAFRATALAVAPKAKLADAPMLRGRIVALNGVPVEKLKVSPDYQWVLSGDRGLTYTDTVPEASKVVAGTWWGKAYAGPPLVSFDAEAAKGLGLKVGDTITVNVLGRDIEAKIANLRRIDWQSLAINFVMVFPPSTLQAAPHRLLATLQLPDKTPPRLEGRLIQSLAERFPLVTAIKVGDVIKAAQALIAKVMTAIEASAGLTLLIGTIVLGGAIASSQDRRKYLAVLYKTLGATRGRVLATELLEFALLGLAVSLVAVGVATLIADLLCRFAFDLVFRFSAGAVLKTVGLALVLVLGLGAIASWRVLAAKSAPYLRAE